MTVSMKIRRLGWGFAWRRGAAVCPRPCPPKAPRRTRRRARPSCRRRANWPGCRCPAATSRRATPARSATRAPPPPTTARRCATIRSNSELLQRAFLSVLAEGDVEEATRLAEQVVALDKNDRIARLVIGVKALKQKKYAAAKQNLTQSVRGPITDLAATLLAAWASYGAGESKARDRVDRQAAGRRLVRAVQGPARGPDPRSLRHRRRKPASASTAPTSSTARRCASSSPTAPGCRATAARTRR